MSTGLNNNQSDSQARSGLANAQPGDLRVLTMKLSSLCPRALLWSLLLFGLWPTAMAQCINDFQLGAVSVSPIPDETVTATTCAFVSEFSVFDDLVAGTTYEFEHESAVGGSYITLTDLNNNVLQHGPSPKLLLATSSGSVRLHYSNDQACNPEPDDCRAGRATTRLDRIFSDRFEAEFQDCDDCPIMVVIAAGTFTQGSPETEPGSVHWERPQREVSVPAFAIGQTKVTFAEWDACVADGGCTHTPGDNGWGRGDRPVMNVNRADMQEFIDWLSQKTGKPYRLPTESEWEYAARAGTTGRFSTGDCITTDQANFDGTGPPLGCPAGIFREQTVPVRSFPANPFGLHEVHGNLWEATEDCWNESYENAPIDGSAWLTGNCELHVLRGGAYYTVGSDLRSANRDRVPRSSGANFIGFRIARSLTP